MVFGLISFILGLLPAFPSFDAIEISLLPMLYVFGLVNNFVSISLLGSCLLLILVVYNIRFVWSIFTWLLSKIPFIS